MRGREATKGKEADKGTVAGDEGAVLEMVEKKFIDMDDPPKHLYLLCMVFFFF